MKSAVWIGIGLTVALGWAQDAGAQTQRPACGDRAGVLAQLKGAYDEKPTALGTTGDGAVVELTTSQNGTWTLLLSLPNGRTCLMATGENWDQWSVRLNGRDS